MKLGDVFVLNYDNGVFQSWEVQGIYLGNVGQESVVHVNVLGQKPASSQAGKEAELHIPVMMIEQMLKTGLLSIFEPETIGGDASFNLVQLALAFSKAEEETAAHFKGAICSMVNVAGDSECPICWFRRRVKYHLTLNEQYNEPLIGESHDTIW